MIQRTPCSAFTRGRGGVDSAYDEDRYAEAIRLARVLARLMPDEPQAAVDAGVLNAIIIIFPLIALAPTALAAVCRADDAASAPGDPQRGGGGPPGPGARTGSAR